MKRNDIPNHVQTKLDKWEQQVEHLTKQVATTQAAIDGARQRLSGGFQRDQEYRDLRASLDKLVTDQPILENKLADARYTLSSCKQFLAALPDDVALEAVKSVKPNGYDLDTVQRRIKDAEDELNKLASVPVPSADIEQRVKQYVAALGRPSVAGVADGKKLDVSWPSNSAVSLLAVLLPDKMVEVILAEIERAANAPLPFEQRRKRMVELRRQTDTLQRQAFALGAGTSDLPPAVVLGVRVASRSSRAA
jgi:hypothetical protein